MPEPADADLTSFYNYEMGRNDIKSEYSDDTKEAVAQLAGRIVGLTGLEKPYIHDDGCGSGYVVRFLNELGFKATGTDISQEAIAAGRARGNENIYAEEAVDLFSRRGQFPDVVFSQHVLEHFYDPVNHLKKLRQSLARGSFFVCFIPNRDYLPILKHGFDRDPAFVYPMHLNYFTPKGLRCALRQAGFEVVHLENTKNLAFAPNMISDVTATWDELNGVGEKEEAILDNAAEQFFLYELFCVAKAS